jgi:hypothetical protein
MSRQRSTNFTLVCSTDDGTDSGLVQFSGGGAVGNTRGAYITLYGNEHASVGDLVLGSGGSTSSIDLYHNNTIQLTLANKVLNYTGPFVISSNTSDGSDNTYLVLCGGGGTSGSTARGAYIQIQGNEVGGSGGRITINAGLGSTQPIVFTASNRNQFIIYDAKLAYHSQGLWIASQTTDTADTSFLALSGGGDDAYSASGTGNNRGGFIVLYGEQHTTYPGQVYIRSANSYAITLLSYGSDVKVSNSNSLLFESTALLKYDSNLTLQATTSDAADSLVLSLSSGGAVSSSRGSYIELRGNEAASNAGRLTLSSGATGDVYITSANASSPTIFLTGTLFGDEGSTKGILFAGSDSLYFPIHANTSDGSDTGWLYLSGGGGTGSSRGAYISLHGNERTGAAGNLVMSAGVASGAYIYIQGETRVEGKFLHYGDTAPLANAVVRRTFKVTTSSATTDSSISIPVTNNSVMKMRVSVCARYDNTGTNKSYWAEMNAGIRRNNSGNAAIIGSASIIQDSENCAYIANMNVSTTNVVVELTGAASESVEWAVHVEYQEVN